MFNQGNTVMRHNECYLMIIQALYERIKHYCERWFCDLVISGLVIKVLLC